VRDFVNERLGVQTRDEDAKREVAELDERKTKEKDEAVEAAIVDPLLILLTLGQS
jgi:hypothetical protein